MSRWIRFLMARKAASLSILFVAGLLSACNTGSETGNPTKGLTGNIVTLDGLPAARTQVILVPDEFNPLVLVKGPSTALHIDTTDSKGRYAFSGVEGGRYNLEAKSLTNGTRFLIKHVAVADSFGVLPQEFLRSFGSVSVALEGAADTATGYLYIPGTTYYKKVVAPSGLVAFDSIPVGRIDSVRFGNSQTSMPPKTVAWNLDVLPDVSTKASGPYLAWTHSAAMLLNTASSGITVSQSVAHVPLRIALTEMNFDFSAARADGSDIRATNEKGEPLPCELQLWDPIAKTANVWILVDTVYADSLQKVRLYWGYNGTGAIPAAWPQGSVFTKADGFVASWHFDEDPFQTGGAMKDRSGRRNDAMAVGYTAGGASVSGVLGSGVSFDGSSQFIGTGQAFDNPNVFTYGGWIKTSSTAGGRVFDFTDSDTSLSTSYWDRLIHVYKDGTVHFGVYPPTIPGTPMKTTGTYKILGGTTPINDGQWHHVAARLSPRGQCFFVDGTKVAEDPASIEAENITGYWRLGYGFLSGWGPAGTGAYFEGVLDEVWISHSDRSDDFIKLVFENQKPGSLLLKFP